MGELGWVKVVTNIFENPKILLIDARKNRDTILTIWFKLMTLAGKCNNAGILSMAGNALTVKEIASLIHRDEAKVESAISIFKEYEMMGIADGAFFVANWSKYQNTQRIEEQKAKNAEYQRNYRAKVKTLCKDLRKPLRNANVRGCVAGAELELEKEEKKETPSGGKERPTPSSVTEGHPSLEDLKAYCIKAKLLHVIPERFFQHYNDRGWVRKNGEAVKDWKAEIAAWDAEDKDKGKPENGKPSTKKASRPDIEVSWLAEYLESTKEKEAPRS